VLLCRTDQRSLNCYLTAVRYLGLISMLAASAFGQSANGIDPRELVRQSIQNEERAWKISTEYACTKRVVEREFNDVAEPKSASDDVYALIPLGYGASFDEHIKHDGEPLSREAGQKEEKELEKLRAEPPALKQRRFEKEQEERSYMNEIPDAFNFRITGTEDLPTGRAWVLEATPRPGFQPKSRYAHVFPKMRGTLWIDRKDVQWVKADAVAVENVSFGLFLFRLAKGSHILIQQTKLPDGHWVPQSLDAKAEAHTLLFFEHNFEEDITYSNYRKPGPLEAAAR
jgi:hypothetical protein